MKNKKQSLPACNEAYINAINIVASMVRENVISEKDFYKAERYFAKKYCIKKGSIYRPNDLINFAFRAIYRTTE